MVQPVELHEMNYLELCDNLRLPDADFETWMQGLGLIHGSMNCDNCHQPMRDVRQGRGRYWICERRECRFGPTNQNKPTKGFFAEDVVVRNNTQAGQNWQKEERDGGLPFHPGQGFTLEFDIGEDGNINIKVNNNDFVIFQARDDVRQISSVEIKGDLTLEAVDVHGPPSGEPPQPPADEPTGQEPIVLPPAEPEDGGDRGPRDVVEPKPQPPAPEPHPAPVEPEQPPPEPVPQQPPRQPEPEQPHPGGAPTLPLPYHTSLQDFHHTRRVRIVGTPLHGAQRFIVNFLSANGEVLFHFNPRFDQNCTVQNATKNHQWQYEKEERHQGCPFEAGKGFALDVIQDGPFFRIFVDGPEYVRFEARDDLGQLDKLEITGDIQLHQVIFA